MKLTAYLVRNACFLIDITPYLSPKFMLLKSFVLNLVFTLV